MRSFIVAAFLVLFAVTCSAQRGIYTINDTKYRTDEHVWCFRTASGYYGLLQFSDRHSAHEAFVRRTSICFGGYEFTVRLPAFAIAALAFLALATAVMLLFAITGRVRRVHRHANAA
jgi:hypothetical protein